MMAGGNMDGRNLLVELLKDHKGGIAVELGVWTGGTTKILCEYFSEVHGVDAWNCRAYYDTTEWDSYYHYIKHYSGIYKINKNEEALNEFYEKTYRHVIKKLYNYPNIKIHRMTTDEFFERNIKYFKNSVDLVYVDASHSERNVYRDLNNSWKILNTGGVLIGDDYGTKYKIGVKLAWDRFIKEKDLSFSLKDEQIIIYK